MLMLICIINIYVCVCVHVGARVYVILQNPVVSLYM
jgi:hypothetical protein